MYKNIVQCCLGGGQYTRFSVVLFKGEGSIQDSHFFLIYYENLLLHMLKHNMYGVVKQRPYTRFSVLFKSL